MTKRIQRILALLTISFMAFTTLPSAQAEETKLGGVCAQAGAIAVSPSGSDLICTPSGKNLYWVRSKAPVPEYKIGAIFPLSGQQASFGKTYQEAIQAGVDFVNTQGKLKGKLNVEFADGQALPAPSVAAMSRLVNVSGVVAVLTGFSGVVRTLAPIANRSEILMFNGGAASPDLRGIGAYVLNNVPLADDQIPQSVDHVVKTLKLRRWAVLSTNDVLGQSMLKSLKIAIPKGGAELVADVSVNPEATDFGSQVIRLVEAKPDIIYLAVAGGIVANLTRQIRQNGINAQMMSFGGNDSPAVIGAPAGEGMLFTVQHLDLTEKSQAYDYMKTKISNPTSLQVNFFNQVLILSGSIKILERNGTKVTGKNLRKKITGIGAFNVIGGETNFERDGTVSLPIDVIKIASGARQVVASYKAGICSIKSLTC